VHALAGLVQARADGFLGAGLLSWADWAEASRAVGGACTWRRGGGGTRLVYTLLLIVSRDFSFYNIYSVAFLFFTINISAVVDVTSYRARVRA
jgi:hypothetical protein